MTKFNETRWAEGEYSGKYIDAADVIVIERQRMIGIVTSFYHHNIMGRRERRLLDLGCGDGILAHSLLGIDSSITATLIDGSEEMVEKAKRRLKGCRDVTFVKASFQELVSEKTKLPGPFSLVVSSLAIHHLPTKEKMQLFELVHAHLEEGGAFINIDTTLSPTERVEEWYIALWREWINEQKERLGAEDDYDEFISKYREENHYRNLDTLQNQLAALKEAGFRDVDCYYKYGMVAIYGGRK
jgi:tRNA (cmo5U34)-methyltransferase